MTKTALVYLSPSYYLEGNRDRCFLRVPREAVCLGRDSDGQTHPYISNSEESLIILNPPSIGLCEVVIPLLERYKDDEWFSTSLPIKETSQELISDVENSLRSEANTSDLIDFDPTVSLGPSHSIRMARLGEVSRIADIDNLKLVSI